jgi:hypothetical protein
MDWLKVLQIEDCRLQGDRGIKKGDKEIKSPHLLLSPYLLEDCRTCPELVEGLKIEKLAAVSRFRSYL